jgi:uncharacterized protein (TIGR01777 family)
MGLEYSSVINAPVEEVFAWHERPGALPRLLPPWQPLKVAQEAPSLVDGQAILQLPGRVRWVAQHSDDDPPRRFVDELVSLPLHWRHTHSFESVGGTATRVIDRVDTPVPGSLLLQTFRYRHSQLAHDMAAHQRMAGRLFTVAVTGSSGLIGSALCAYLTTGGHRVVRLVRRPPLHPSERTWDPQRPDPRVLEGVDAVVHLAGASIAGRFSEAHKRRVRDSRIGPTAGLARVMAGLPDGPRVLVCASAIGYYGPDRGSEELTEESGQGSGFLAEVVEAWEAAAEPAIAAGVRVVHVRTGIVQSARGASLKILRPLFSAGLGGPLAPGSQWVSWIDLDDLLDVFGRALADDALAGPVNAVAPFPVPNRDYSSILGRVMRRPALLPVPAFGPRLLLGGEGAREIVQASQRVVPARLSSAGHIFRYPSLEGCLRHQLGHVQDALPGEETSRP